MRDWHIVDSMTVQLEKELQEEYPGAGDYAALMVHKRYSVGVGTTSAFDLSPAREHDAPHLTNDESWRGLGLLWDLGHASHDLLRACAEFDVRYVIRLKENWKARVTHIARGQEAATFVAGTDFDQLRAEGVIRLDGRVIDLDVDLGSGRKTFRARLVGVHTDKGYCFYLTNLPPKAAPRTVADLYRIRWEIELDNKLDKSCHRLDEIGARTGPAVRALVYASIVASILACLVVHRHRLRRPGAARNHARRGAQRVLLAPRGYGGRNMSDRKRSPIEEKLARFGRRLERAGENTEASFGKLEKRMEDAAKSAEQSLEAFGSNLNERFEKLEEALQIILPMLRDERPTFSGRHYSVTEAINQPVPLSRIPVMIGGSGEKKTLRHIARYGDIWHAFVNVESYRHKSAVLAQHCADVGRDPSEIERSAEVRFSGDVDSMLRFADDITAEGVTLLTVAAGGPDYDLTGVEELVKWRDALQG